MKNERLASIFATAPYETRLLVSMVEALAGANKVEEVLADLEAPSSVPDVMIEGRPLRFYSGLNDAQLSAVGLSAEGKAQLSEHFERGDGSGGAEMVATEEAPEEAPAKSSRRGSSE